MMTSRKISPAEEEVQHAPIEAPTMIKLQDVTKTFSRGKESVGVLRNLSLEIPKASFEAIMGPSGSGKTTMLHLLAGLDRPTSGSVEVDGQQLQNLSEAGLATWRANNIGFIFQAHNLLPVLTAVENVELPLLLMSLPAAERRRRAMTALRIVGLENRMGHYPRQLSGGQEQRVAIARALVNDPKILVADEPTGSLDRQSADDILELLTKLNKEFSKTIVMVTHDPAAAERASATRRLDKGRLS